MKPLKILLAAFALALFASAAQAQLIGCNSNTASGNVVMVTTPAGAQAGDLLTFTDTSLASAGGMLSENPGTWTAFPSKTDNGVVGVINGGALLLASAPAASYSVTGSNSTSYYQSAILCDWRGVALDGMPVVADNPPQGSMTPTGPAATASGSDLAAVFFGFPNPETYIPPVGFVTSPNAFVNNSATVLGSALSFASAKGPGAVGPFAGTFSANSYWAAMTILLKPSGSTPTPSPSPTATPTVSPSPSPSSTPTITPSVTPTPTMTPSPTPAPSPTPSPVPSVIATCGASLANGAIITLPPSSQQYQIEASACPASPTPAPSGTPTPVGPAPTPGPTPSAGSGIGLNVTSYGVMCDGVTDDTAAFNALFATAKEYCSFFNGVARPQVQINLPTGSLCVINEGITYDTSCIALKGDGSVFIAPNLPNNTAAITMTTNSNVELNPNFANTSQDDIKVIGPAPSLTSGTTGIEVQAPSITLRNPATNSFQYGAAIGSYGYVVNIYNGEFKTDMAGFFCPNGYNDSGEQIQMFGGVLGNSTYGAINFGCELNLYGTSIDSTQVTAILNGGNTRGYGVHVENEASLPWSCNPADLPASILQNVASDATMDPIKTAACGTIFSETGNSAYSSIQMFGGVVQWDGQQGNTVSNPSDVATISDNGNAVGYGGTVLIEGMSLDNLWPSAPEVNGACALARTYLGDCTVGTNIVGSVSVIESRSTQGNVYGTAPAQINEPEICETAGCPSGTN